MKNRELKYSDIFLLPEHSEINTRSEASTEVTLGANTFKAPIVPANMKAVIDEKKAKWLSENNYFYIMHRFGMDPIDFCSKSEGWRVTSISVGVKNADKDHVKLLSSRACKVDYITVDIAHGHCKLMKDMIAHIKQYLPNTFIIAGNVATGRAVLDLADWGADCVKIGIGQGHVCTTKDKTGFTRPMFSSVLECSPSSPVPIIADGGIQCNGDIAKALAAGADMVMAGSLFSQCTDSPAVSTIVNGKTYKQYFGSASEHNKGERKHVEGVMREVPSNGMRYEEKFEEIIQDLQSSISYSGGKDISSLGKAEWGIYNK